MGRGEGKGWAKGLSAATDPRVARAAAAHRGLIYERKSGDRQLVDTYLATLGRTNRVRTEKTRKGVVFVTQFGDARLYEWLRAVGLTPRKSLTLGALDVPDSFVLPLARGLDRKSVV